MKNLKKVFTLVLALIMVMGLATTAMAANITIDDDDVTGAEYSAYRLLDLTTSLKASGHPTECDGTTHVSGCYNYAYTVNAKYRAALQTVIGAGSTDEAIIAAIGAMNAEAIRDFADAVYELVKGTAPDATAASNVFSNVPQGYYLIVETATGSVDGFEEETFSLVMLDTAGQEDVTVDTKEELPESQKKVKDANDSTGDVSDWQDSADHDIGDEVPFQITFTLPSDFAEYESYYVGIHDVQSEGLTFKDRSLTVTVNGDANKDLTTAFTYSVPETACAKGCTFHIQCADIIAAAAAAGFTLKAGDQIVFEYTSTLNEDAVLGATGNPNKMTIEFSNNPYGDGTSYTPWDRVIVFTYKVNADKYADKVAEGNELSGAEFTLYKEVEVPADYEDAQTGAEIKAAFASNVKADDLDDETYYVEITRTETESDGDTFGFKGVDDGNYVLVETRVPAGYNAWDDVAFTITAKHSTEAENPVLTELKGGDLFSGDVSELAQSGVLDTDIVNETGRELPSTGGIGTTIFYVVGGLLAAAAVVLLITRRRMASAE